MPYCSIADLKLAIPDQTLIWLTCDDPQAPAMNLPVAEEAIRQAEELVDGFLRGRYALPLASVPTLVKDMSVHLARHWLYARRPEGADLPDAVKDGQKNALRILENIRDGKITLGLPAALGGKDAPEPGEMKVKSRPQVFSTSMLGAY
ncbi:MAG: DUF1320 domain-containing protein [Zoogloeaceae bacterium]|jgi:phage gp36-like protein|nr:DUF1320 domain-containing protein [Zoogloeaceae bacterium]